jgi:hypothetical protein
VVQSSNRLSEVVFENWTLFLSISFCGRLSRPSRQKILEWSWQHGNLSASSAGSPSHICEAQSLSSHTVLVTVDRSRNVLCCPAQVHLGDLPLMVATWRHQMHYISLFSAVETCCCMEGGGIEKISLVSLQGGFYRFTSFYWQ